MLRRWDIGGGKYRLNGTKYDAITYSLPLINAKGVVYGVVGIDITLDYLSKILPSTELLDDENSCYMIALNQDGELSMEGFAVSGSACEKNTSKVNLTKLTIMYAVRAENYTRQGSASIFIMIIRHMATSSGCWWGLRIQNRCLRLLAR